MPSSTFFTQFQNPGNKIFGLPALSVFLLLQADNRPMLFPPLHRSFCSAWRAAVGSLLALLLSGSLLFLSADTPSVLRSSPVGGCFCKCSPTAAHPSCVKLCTRPRYVGRRKITKCARPRLQVPAERRDPGPRFPHPGRPERASAAP